MQYPLSSSVIFLCIEFKIHLVHMNYIWFQNTFQLSSYKYFLFSISPKKGKFSAEFSGSYISISFELNFFSQSKVFYQPFFKQ